MGAAAAVVLVVLDSNVLFSGLISDKGHPGLCRRAWSERRFELVTCREQIAEINRSSRYPHLSRILQPHRVGRMVNDMRRARFIDPLPRRNTADDPEDAYLLDLAEVSGANYLVTGDKRSGLLQRQRIARTSIVTASEFCSNVLRIL